MTDQEIVTGRGDIAQASGTLGMNVYAQVEYRDVLQTFFSSADVGQGSGAVAWLTGSFFGGNDAIAQRFPAATCKGICLPAAWVRDRVPWPG